MACPIISWASARGIVSQLSGLEHQRSLKESNLQSQWKKLKQQILKQKPWENDEIYQHISDCRNESNRPNLSIGANGAEECCPFSMTQGALENGHPPRAYCDTPGECRLLLDSSVTRFCREVILGLNSEEGSSSITAQRWWPRWSERSNSAGFVRWTHFFCTFWTADSGQSMHYKRLGKLYIVGLSILCISQSDMRHQTFSLGSS
jgi:hypothetical protein